MVARDEVAFLFWGDKPDKVARKNLRETISRLRGALADPHWVLTDPELVGLDFNHIYTDLQEFNALTDPVIGLCNRTPLDQPLPQPIHQKITKAISLWRSPKCMAGFILTGSNELEQWFTYKAYQVEQVYLNLLERLSFHALVSINFEECLYYARQGIAAEPSREGFHYVTLRALLSMGRYAQAREYVQTHLQPLAEEGYSLTNPELLELIQQTHESKPTHSKRAVQPRLNLHATLNTPFVGRQALLDQLWRRFYSGGGGLILGETGQGKTRLLEQFIRQAAPSARLLTATCRPSDTQLALQPFIDLIRDHFEERDWLAIPALWAAQLARIFPELIALRHELRASFTELTNVNTSATLQSNLYEALRQAFWAIAQQEKLLICIDGIQWADETTLAALLYLLARPPFIDHSVMVMSARIHDRRANLEQLEQYLRRSSHGTVLEMNGLTLDETRTLLHHLLPDPPTEAFIQKIYTDSGGNPLYILESFRAALEQGIDLVNDQVESIPVPNKFVQLIQQRLEDLSAPERNLLEVAAIYGTEFDPAVVQIASEYPLDQFTIYMDQLYERRLIEPLSQPSKEHRYRFIHSKFREVILEEIPELRRRWLHRKIANALSTHSELPYNHPAILAEHYEQAHDPTIAFQYWVLAAQHARRTHSVDDALERFARAEQQLKLASDLTTRQIYDFYSDWAKMAYEVEQLALLKEISQALLQIGFERQSDLLIGAANDARFDALLLEKKFEEALECSQQTQRFLERTGHAQALAKMYIRRGECLVFLNRFNEADFALRSALEQHGDERDPRYLHSIATTHGQLAMLSMYAGWPARSLQHAQEAQKYYDAIHDPFGKVIAYNAMARAHYYLGNNQTGKQYCEIGIELAEKIKTWRYLGSLYSYAAMIDLATGNIDSSLNNIRQILHIGNERGHSELIAVGNYLIGNIFSWLLDHEQAYQYYQAAYEINQNPFLASNILFRTGFSQSLAVNAESGLATLDQVIHSTAMRGLELETLQSSLTRALVLYKTGQHDGLFEMATEIAEQARQRVLKSIQLSAEMIIALLKVRSNGVKAEYEALEALLNRATAISHHFLKLLFMIEIGKLDPGRQSALPIDQADLSQFLDQLAENAQDPLIQSSFRNFRKAFTR